MGAKAPLDEEQIGGQNRAGVFVEQAQVADRMGRGMGRQLYDAAAEIDFGMVANFHTRRNDRSGLRGPE